MGGSLSRGCRGYVGVYKDIWSLGPPKSTGTILGPYNEDNRLGSILGPLYFENWQLPKALAVCA